MLRYIEGFDYLPTFTPPYSSAASTTASRLLRAMGWQEINSFQLGFSASGRFGGKALWFGNQAITGTDGDKGRLFWPLGNPIDDGFFGCALSVGDNSDFIIYLVDTSTIPSGSSYGATLGVVYSVRITTLGVIQVYAGTVSSGTLLTSSLDKRVDKEAFFYIEIGWGASGLSVRLNTIPVISLPTATAGGIDAFGFGRAASGGYCYVDDLYVCDNTGSANNSFLGNVRAQWLTLASNFSTQWTSYNLSIPNYQAASNTSVDDTSYVKNAMAETGDTDLYNVTPLVNSPVIFGLAIKGAYRQDDATQGFVKNVVQSNSTLWQGSAYATYTTYTFNIDILETDPDTGSGWLYTAINAIQVGPKQA